MSMNTQTVINILADLSRRVGEIQAIIAEDRPFSDRINAINDVITDSKVKYQQPMPMLARVDRALELLKEDNRRMHEGMSFVGQMLSQHGAFVSKVCEELAGNFSADDIAREISLSDIAEYVSASDVANEIDLNDVASNIDTGDLARELSEDSDFSAEVAMRMTAGTFTGSVVEKITSNDCAVDLIADAVCAKIAQRINP